MTETYKQLAQAVGTSEYLSVYTAPSSTSAIASTTSIVNSGGSGIYSVAVVPANEYASIVTVTTPGGPLYTQVGQAFIGPEAWSTLGAKTCISRDGTTIAFLYDVNGAEKVSVYTFDGTTWVQKGSDIFDQSIPYSTQWGKDMALSADGDTLVIGANIAYQQDGRVAVFRWEPGMGGYWNSASNGYLSDDQANTSFGSAVAISDSGMTIAVAARNYDVQSPYADAVGGIYVYDNDPAVNNIWTLRSGEPLVLTGLGAGTEVGSVSLSADGNTVSYSVPYISSFALGMPLPDSPNVGAIRTFDWNGTSWIERPILIGNYDWAYLGAALKLSSDGNILAATQRSDPFTNSSDYGSLRVWTWNGSSWQTRGTQMVGELYNGDYGLAMDMSADGNRIVVGGGAFSGSRIYIYDWDGNDWIQLFDQIFTPGVLDRVGYSVGISGDGAKLIFSRIFSDQQGSGTGSAYVYELTNNTEVTELIPLEKHVVIKSKAINAGEHHELTGGIVAGSGDHILFTSTTDAIINISGVEIS